MTRFLSILLISLFVGVAVFGAVGMALHMDGGELPCAASVLGSTVCPTDQVLFAIHHLGVYEFLSRATPVFVFLSLIIFTLSLAGFATAPYLPKPVFRSPYRNNRKENKPAHMERLTRWLSLFELSPSF